MILPIFIVVSISLTAAVGILCVSNAKLWIELKAMQKSTHQIVMPTAYAENVFEKQDENTEKSLNEAFSDYVGIN